jgi:hypothetical protein
VKRGDNIAVVIGDFKVEHLTVNPSLTAPIDISRAVAGKPLIWL